MVVEAYSFRVNPADVRIVHGPGRSPIAQVAFLNGNPAITIGNTFYIVAQRYRDDLSMTTDGIELLVHEYTHVVQYARHGFARFGKRYAAELRANGYDASRLYAYKKRNLRFEQETLEGQAAIVGDYASNRLSKAPEDREAAENLRLRLHGTGIYGN